MSFFTDPKVQDIVQGNIKKVEKLEAKEAERMLTTFKKVRGDLQERLLFANEGTFTEQHLRVSLVQVDAVLQALAERLKVDIGEGAQKLGEQGVEDLSEEIERFSRYFGGSTIPIPLDTIAISLDTTNYLINRYESSIDAYSGALRQQITQGLTESLIARDNFSTAVYKLQRFMKGEEWRVQRIARTELHNVYNLAKQNGMEEAQTTIPDLKKSLFHPMDNRTGEDSKLAARMKLVVDIDEPFSYTFNGKRRVYMVPPDRPNDRSILVPYRESWNK